MHANMRCYGLFHSLFAVWCCPHTAVDHDRNSRPLQPVTRQHTGGRGFDPLQGSNFKSRTCYRHMSEQKGEGGKKDKYSHEESPAMGGMGGDLRMKAELPCRKTLQKLNDSYIAKLLIFPALMAQSRP
jgi:hypothetical protein